MKGITVRMVLAALGQVMFTEGAKKQLAKLPTERQVKGWSQQVRKLVTDWVDHVVAQAKGEPGSVVFGGEVDGWFPGVLNPFHVKNDPTHLQAEITRLRLANTELQTARFQDQTLLNTLNEDAKKAADFRVEQAERIDGLQRKITALSAEVQTARLIEATNPKGLDLLHRCAIIGAPAFVLAGYDQLAPDTVDTWAEGAFQAGVRDQKVIDAKKVAVAMRRHQEKHGRRMPS